MTTGQIIFYSGIGMLILTVIIGIAFWIKKPRYTPEDAVYQDADGRGTQKLRSGYPTDRLTVRRESEPLLKSDTATLHDRTERLGAEQTEPIIGTEVLAGTEVLNTQQTEKLESEVDSHPTGTIPLMEDIVSSASMGTTLPLAQKETVPLVEDGEHMVQVAEENNETESLSHD